MLLAAVPMGMYTTPSNNKYIDFPNSKHFSHILQFLFNVCRSSVCTEDWLEIFILFRDGSDRFIGRYCGFTAPGKHLQAFTDVFAL